MSDNNYVDLGEVTFAPVINENVPTDNVITYDQIYDGINNVIQLLKDKQYNIVAVDEAVVHLLSDFTRNVEDFKYSLSYMKDYKVINIDNKFNPYVKTIVLHSGIGLDIEQMNLRLFCTIPYMMTNPIYITLLNHDNSDHKILNVSANSCYGYGFSTTYETDRSPYDLYIK